MWLTCDVLAQIEATTRAPSPDMVSTPLTHTDVLMVTAVYWRGFVGTLPHMLQHGYNVFVDLLQRIRTVRC